MDENRKRILLVDDNSSIHEDFKQILQHQRANSEKDVEQLKLESELFSENATPNKKTDSVSIHYTIDDAFQGEEAIAMVEAAELQGNPYALIFMDVRMPPGIDGIQTVQRIWEKHPHVEVVICTAHSDYSWDDILVKFGSTDHLLFVQKPFNGVTIKQIALAMTTKWELDRQNREHIKNLEKRIAKRTQELVTSIEEKEGYIKQIKDDMILAEIVQHQLLPSSLPSIKSIEVAAIYIPATGIGGDFYDVIQLDEKKLAFFIFDVSGHGIAAALVTAIGKYSFMRHLKDHHSPEKVLEFVNKDIHAITPTQMYLTALLMIYNTETGEALYSGAGHVPQVLYRADSREIIELKGRGLFIGYDRDSTYVRQSIRLQKNDKLVFFTDGLTESSNGDDVYFGKERVQRAIMENGHLSCNDLLQQIIKINKTFIGEKVRNDDLCILTIDIKGE